MLDLNAALLALAATALLAFGGWLASIARHDVSIVDSLWALFFLLGAAVYVSLTNSSSARTVLVLSLVTLWALRLSVYLTWRNWSKPEDRRYRAIRVRNEPRFAWKSVYLIFGFQVVLAWICAVPLYVALGSAAPLGVLDLAGAVLWVAGFACEALADWQLGRFRADPANRGRVLDNGLWRYTRHPNYFGEALLWWGVYLIAASAGGAWTVFAPLLLTWLLLRVSGVTLLEQDMHERRPAYRDYVARTSAFLPLPPRGRA